MRKSLILLSMFIITATQSVLALGQSTDVLVEKIRYCRTGWPLCNDKLLADYHWWEDHGVPDQIQKNTYIGKYNQPSKANTKHLVFVASGQRFEIETLGGEGDYNLLTGQPEWNEYGYTESSRWFSISTASLAYGLFNRDIYDESDTFSALAFDARFNWGFSVDNKLDIVNAYYSWLKSKVYSHKLESIYLAGHSRGGALVLRLAQKFQQEFPHVPVIVHTFDPVPNMKEGELGAYSSYIDNPVAGFPRDTALLENKGNWSWRSNLINQYPNKKNLFIYNFLVGGSIFGLAQEVRSVTHETGTGEETELGWYFQRWVDAGKSGSGHMGIARDEDNVNEALDHLEDRLGLLRNNLSPHASASASSTYCTSTGGNHCYSANRIKDLDMDSRVGGLYSWANKTTSLPQWVQLTWPERIRTDRIEIITSEGYPLQNFDIQRLDGSTWRTVRQVSGNQAVRRTVTFPEIQTRAIRVVGTRGPDRQPQYVRLNEVLVEGDWVVRPNTPPIAVCNASPDTGQGVLDSTLTVAGSYDPDGTIVRYEWYVSDGSTGSGDYLTHTFFGIPYETSFHTATLIVTDDRGATSSDTCLLTVY